MRYRLRTLLIVVTTACVYLAWVGHCWRMARFHREQSSELLLQVVKQEANVGRTRTLEWEESLMSDLIEGLPEQAAKMNDTKWVDEQGQNPEFAFAVVHEIKARKYDRAAWKPWVLISD